MELTADNQINVTMPDKKSLFGKKSKISKEDAEIIDMLNKVTKELRFAQLSFDLTNDETLTDSFIYEIMALNKRHSYYMKLCKERGLAAEGF